MVGEEEEGEDHSWPRAKRRRSEDVLAGGVADTPRVPPLPSWWHPPLALPAQAKEELLEAEEVLEPGDKEAGVTPPLMSPGLVAPFPPGIQPPGVVDPRQLLHLLARKVRQLFADILSPDKTMLLIKLCILFLQNILGKYLVCQSFIIFSVFRLYLLHREAGRQVLILLGILFCL